MAFDTNVIPTRDNGMKTICPYCGAELDIDWRDWDNTIGDVTIYHLWCERCDTELYASKNMKYDSHPQQEDLLIPIEDFKELVKSGAFTDYDGSGYYASEDWTSRIDADLEDVVNGNYPDWVKYVEWYNK